MKCEGKLDVKAILLGEEVVQNNGCNLQLRSPGTSLNYEFKLNRQV